MHYPNPWDISEMSKEEYYKLSRKDQDIIFHIWERTLDTIKWENLINVYKKVKAEKIV